MEPRTDGDQAEAHAKKDLMKLLKSRDLSPEEHKKILAIATSVGRTAEAHDEEHAGLPMGKAIFILMGLIGIALMVIAWFFLSQIRTGMDNLGPRSGGRPASTSSPSPEETQGPGGPRR